MANVTSISEARKRRSWNRLRWDWQKAILADPDLPDRSKLLACVLVSQFAHHESAECRPGLPALADALSVSVDTVKRGLSSLEAGGWIERSAGRGRGNKLSISFLFAGAEKGGSAAPFYPEKGCSPAPLSGSYPRVAAFARRWKADRQREQQTLARGTFVPLHFAPGDAFQFDWSEDFAVLGGERTKLQMAHIKLSHMRHDPAAGAIVIMARAGSRCMAWPRPSPT